MTDYKEGKAYSYFDSKFLKEVKYHPVNRFQVLYFVGILHSITERVWRKFLNILQDPVLICCVRFFSPYIISKKYDEYRICEYKERKILTNVLHSKGTENSTPLMPIYFCRMIFNDE
jgi:hypothetical protein